MQFRTDQIEIAKRLTIGASVFQNCYLKDGIFRDQFKDNYNALICFVQNYAYARQGAARAYPIIAEMAIKELFQGKLGLVTVEDARNAWKIYREIADKAFNNVNLNPNLNPMRSDRGVIATLAMKKINNLSLYVTRLIQKGKTAEAHSFIASIRGVGNKIASLYLRDISYLGNLDESKIINQHYLQPIDTWLEQALSIIFKGEVPARLNEKQKLIVELCTAAGCSPIEFNQGAWVLGSQIAGDFKTFNDIARGPNSKSLIQEYVLTRREYLDEVERIISRFS